VDTDDYILLQNKANSKKYHDTGDSVVAKKSSLQAKIVRQWPYWW
jgi:hypothetical protein